jgi:hypothetical protein
LAARPRAASVLRRLRRRAKSHGLALNGMIARAVRGLAVRREVIVARRATARDRAMTTAVVQTI